MRVKAPNVELAPKSSVPYDTPVSRGISEQRGVAEPAAVRREGAHRTVQVRRSNPVNRLLCTHCQVFGIQIGDMKCPPRSAMGRR